LATSCSATRIDATSFQEHYPRIRQERVAQGLGVRGGRREDSGEDKASGRSPGASCAGPDYGSRPGRSRRSTGLSARATVTALGATSAAETSRLISVDEIETEVRSSPLALAVLSLLHAAPLHPYAMQRLLKEWGKDQVINVGQRANLYKTIKRLLQAGLIAVRQTERDQQYPERTVYELTESGRRVAHNWLTEMVVRPRNEFAQFPAALSFLMMLTPDEARTALEQRASALRAQLATIEADLANYGATLPRVTLMDDEYQRTIISAELAWVDGVLADLSTGALSWSDEDFAALGSYLSEAGLSPVTE